MATVNLWKWFVPLMSWQTFYMWKYDSSSNSYSSRKFYSIPEICCWLGLAIDVSTFFKFWSYISSKSYMATFLGISLSDWQCNVVIRRLIQHCSCLLIRLMILLDPCLQAKRGLMKASLLVSQSVNQNHYF